MSMSYELKFVSNQIAFAPDSIRRIAGQVVSKTAFDIEAHAKILVPVDTGFLKSSIQVRRISDLESLVTVGAEYGIYVELGTRFQAAQPYLAPAVTASRHAFESAMNQVFDLDMWTL